MGDPAGKAPPRHPSRSPHRRFCDCGECNTCFLPWPHLGYKNISILSDPKKRSTRPEDNHSHPSDDDKSVHHSEHGGEAHVAEHLPQKQLATKILLLPWCNSSPLEHTTGCCSC